MNFGAKVAAILVCAAVCATGLLLKSKERTNERQPKSEIAPVINRQSHREIWLRV
jgi:hypothetical protein